MEFHFIRTDDSERIAHSRANVTYTISGEPIRLLGVFQDITDSKMAINAVIKEKEKAQQYLDIAGVIFMALYKTGEVTLINKKGCEILGFESSEIVGTNWFETFIPEKHREILQSIFLSVMQGKSVASGKLEHSIINKKGKERMISWHNTILYDDKDQIIGTLSSGEDITERKIAEEKLGDAMDALQKSNEELKRLSITDGLTELYNRRYIEYILDLEFEKARRYNSSLSCLMMDIDHFKTINDTYGHQAGDQVLKTLSSIIRSNSRKIDICGRFGGEEFIIITNQKIEDAFFYAEKMLQIVRNNIIRYNEIPIQITISIGVAAYINEMKSPDEMVKKADDCLYQAKNTGRNRIVI